MPQRAFSLDKFDFKPSLNKNPAFLLKRRDFKYPGFLFHFLFRETQNPPLLAVEPKKEEKEIIKIGCVSLHDNQILLHQQHKIKYKIFTVQIISKKNDNSHIFYPGNSK